MNDLAAFLLAIGMHFGRDHFAIRRVLYGCVCSHWDVSV